MILAPVLATIAVFQPSAGTNAIAGPIFIYAAIIGIFYFILIRPQQQQRKKLESTIKTLKKGDRVVTAGGLVGDVVHIRETVSEGTTTATMDDEVTLKSGESRVIVERRGIARGVMSAYFSPLTSTTATRSRLPTCGAASPMPCAAYIVSNMSSISRRTSSSGCFTSSVS